MMASETSSSSQPAGGRRWWIAAAVAIACILAATCVTFVDEREAVIIERFGNIVNVYDRPQDRGLRFKLPWPIDVAKRFDRRVQLFDPPAREMFTRDKKNVSVDVYLCWKIAEPPAEAADLSSRPVVRFYRGLGSSDLAEARLESRIRSILSTAIGQVELGQLLGVKSSEVGPGAQVAGRLEEISSAVRDAIVRRANEAESIRERLGVEIVDARITRLNLPAGNQQAVFDRMRSERKKIADRYRAAGQAESQMIRSQADRQAAEVLARAKADAERTRGAAEAEAVRILNAAHAQDPEFYNVLATLDAYRKILNEKTTLVLSSSSSLLKLLTEGVPEPKGAVVAPTPGGPAAKQEPPSRPEPKTPARAAVGVTERRP